MDYHLLVKVNASNVAAVMAALAPFGGDAQPAPQAVYQPQAPQAAPQMPPQAPQAAYQPQVGAPPPGMVAPQGAPQMPPQMPPQAPQGAVPSAIQPQQVYQAMQNYAAQYRADGVGRVFARFGVPAGGGLHTCTPDQLAQIKAHFESMQPA